MVFSPGIFMVFRSHIRAFSTKWKTGELGGADFGLLEVTGDFMEISWNPCDETWWNMIQPNGELPLWGKQLARILVGIGSKLKLF